MHYSTYQSLKRLILLLFILTGFSAFFHLVSAQSVNSPSSITGDSEPIATNTFSLCAGSSLILTASCDQGNYAVWPGDERNPFEIVVLPGVQTYNVTCSDEENYSAPVTVTVIGGCVETCSVPPSATNFHANATLSAENCSVQLSAMASGRAFQFTGPGGYVFSNVYRNCQESITVYANDVKLPGIYYLKVDGGGEPVIYTIEVGGTACPK